MRRAIGLAAVALALGCGSDVERHPARGIVRGVMPELRQVKIDHEDVPGLMPAMTMNFGADPALLADLEVGQAVDFVIEFDGRNYLVVEIEPSGEATAGRSGGGFADLPEERDPAPGFDLIDQAGRPLTLESLRGDAVLLDFVYTACPGPCPILTGVHVELQRALTPAQRARTHFVSISMDPERDTPEVLGGYARARGVDLSHWSFLTGPPEQVQAVVDGYGVGTIRQPSGEIDHMVATFMIDPQGRIAHRYLGLEHEPEELLADLSGLLGE